MRWFSLIFPSWYISRNSHARVTWRFHGHLPSGFCQLYCMLEVSGPVRVCFSTNCLTWIAGAQGGNGGRGRPCSSLTTTPFRRRKARSGSYRHFDQYSAFVMESRMNTDPKSSYLFLIFPIARIYLFIAFILTTFVFLVPII